MHEVQDIFPIPIKKLNGKLSFIPIEDVYDYASEAEEFTAKEFNLIYLCSFIYIWYYLSISRCLS